MRKIDYTVLANLIRAQLDAARLTRDNSPDIASIQHAGGAVATLEHVAYKFAARASVDRNLFLRECGL